MDILLIENKKSLTEFKYSGNLLIVSMEVLMKKKLLGVLCLFLVCISCKNTTNDEKIDELELEKESETVVEKNDDNDKNEISGDEKEFENNQKEDNEEENKDDTKSEEDFQVCEIVNASFELEFEQNDIEFEIEKNDTKICLTCKDYYDDYEWYMGTRILSNMEYCEIDFAGYEKNVYPIVLFARKNGIVYSNVYYVNYSGTNFVEQSSRTIFPVMQNNNIGKIHLEIVDLNSDKLILKDFEDYNNFKSEVIELNEGLYSVSVSAQIGNRTFCGNDKINVEKNQLVYSILMELNSFEAQGIEKGMLNISAYFMTKNQIVDANYSLFQKKDDKFILYSMDKLDGGNLILIDGENEYTGFKGFHFSLDDIEPGDYWLRVNGITSDRKEKCYQVEYIYIEENQKSEKIIEISDFFDMYTISYDFAGGFFTGKDLTTQYSSFDSLSFPDEKQMVYPGYKFTGWYFDKELSNKAESGYGAGIFASELNLYAGWQKLDDSSNEKEKTCLENSKIQVTSVNKNFIISFPLEKKIAQEIESNSDLLTIKLYDKKNALIGFAIQNIDWQNENVSFEMICDLKKNEYYLMEINVYNPVVLRNGFKMNEKIFCDKQLIKKE